MPQPRCRAGCCAVAVLLQAIVGCWMWGFMCGRVARAAICACTHVGGSCVVVARLWLSSVGVTTRQRRQGPSAALCSKQTCCFCCCPPAVPCCCCCTESVKPRGVVDLSKVQDVKDGRSVTGKANTVQLKTASGGSVCYVCDSGVLTERLHQCSCVLGRKCNHAGSARLEQHPAVLSLLIGSLLIGTTKAV